MDRSIINHQSIIAFEQSANERIAHVTLYSSRARSAIYYFSLSRRVDLNKIFSSGTSACGVRGRTVAGRGGAACTSGKVGVGGARGLKLRSRRFAQFPTTLESTDVAAAPVLSRLSAARVAFRPRTPTVVDQITPSRGSTRGGTSPERTDPTAGPSVDPTNIPTDRPDRPDPRMD